MQFITALIIYANLQSPYLLHCLKSCMLKTTHFIFNQTLMPPLFFNVVTPLSNLLG